MTYEELIKMYLDWADGADDTLKESDVIAACLEAGYSYKNLVHNALAVNN